MKDSVIDLNAEMIGASMAVMDMSGFSIADHKSVMNSK